MVDGSRRVSRVFKLPLEMKVYEDVKLNIIAPAFYLLEFDTKETQSITIPRHASMTDIKDHPSFCPLQ
jgi:hypothetical protein